MIRRDLMPWHQKNSNTTPLFRQRGLFFAVHTRLPAAFLRHLHSAATRSPESQIPNQKPPASNSSLLPTELEAQR
jgi:hypothetical protein